MEKELREKYEKHNQEVMSYPRFSSGHETPPIVNPAQYERFLKELPDIANISIISLPL